MDFELTLNGRTVKVENASTNATLADWLRSIGMTGTKQGCAEGDCGACTVALVERDSAGRACYRAINSCIALLPMFAGRELVTVEGLEEHPVQRAMVDQYGSQCGYCTPGFVMSMFEGFYRDIDSPPAIADQLCGNLCRCTGYRPIRDAMCDAIAQRTPQDAFTAQLDAARFVASSLDYEANGQRFLRPTTVSELLELRARHQDAVLVAGATEIGVEITKKAKKFPLLISTEAVGELREVKKAGKEWHVGGAATLTALEESLAGAIPAIQKMLAVFASRQIRNRATLAGNLVTASPIGDMAPVLLALEARVVLASRAGRRSLSLDEFLAGYRKTALRADEILEWIVIPEQPTNRKTDSFKVSKRRELDIAIVAAGFSVDLSPSGTVEKARLAYGGVAPMTVRARRAEAALQGRPWTRVTLDAVLPILAAEFAPITDARGSADYRRALVPSLFEKFFTGQKSEAMDLPLGFLPGARWSEPEASKALRHESGLGHATGRARYVFDQAARRSMLEVWPVLSPHAHAKILRRDATAARQTPGIVAVLFAQDVPGTNDVGAVRHDEPLLAGPEALYHGHMVALVVGETIDACRDAAAKVTVEYEPLPAILTTKAAIAKNSYHTDPHVIRRGDARRALDESPHRLSGEIEMGGQEHFYLETHAAWAEPGDEGDVKVVSSTQHPSEIQSVVGHVLGISKNKVVVESPRMGGGFGGKETQGNMFAALVALAAWKTGRPTRLMLDRDLDMKITGKRHPFLASFEVGFDHEGRLEALSVSLTSNGGWSLDLSQSILDRAIFHLDNAYYVPAVHFEGRVARTHVASNTAFRGFGGPQGLLVIEEILDRVARSLGIAPETVRERNLYRGSGDTATTHYGELIEDNRIGKIWKSLLASSDFEARRAEIARWNERSPHAKRGIAITPVKFGISFTATFLNQAGALVHVYRDGSVQVNHGGTEMGQGLQTKVLGVAMRELGLPRERIRVMKTATDKVPNTSATAASAGADLNGAAVRNACKTLRDRLAAVAETMSLALDAATWDKVVERAFMERVGLSAVGYYATPGIHYDREKGKGRPFHYYAFGAAVTEVEVDGSSGMKRVRRVDVLHDVGDSLNPGIDRGQVEGGFVQGMGWLTGEELVWDEKGRLLTHSASTYQIPAISDAPVDFRVALLPHAAQANTIHGSKAVGEPPLMLALSVREALRDAVAAFGEPGGAVELASPATHEALFKAIRARLSRPAVPAR